MIKRYISPSLKQLFKSKVNTIINVAGLSVSIACCIFVYVFVKHEYSFDDFHSRKDRIYRMVFEEKKENQTEYNGTVPFPFAKALRNDFPQLETVTQVYVNNKALISIPATDGTQQLFEDAQMTYADEFFFKTFDFKRIAGSSHLLQRPDEVVLTRSLVDKFYGKPANRDYSSFINKTIVINKNNYRITAVLEDIPRNSNLACHLFLPYKVFEKNNPAMVSKWKDLYSESYTFVTLPYHYSAVQFEAALVAFKNKYIEASIAKHHVYHAQPLAEVHSDATYGGTYYSTPAILILAFVLMAAIVLLTSCINFINLATVQAFKRAKEVGIRKTLGSGKGEIIFRFMTETFLLITIASIIAVFLGDYFLRAFSNYLLFIVELNLHTDYTVIIFLILLGLLITLLAGYYPAKVMSSFRPVQALKHAVTAKKTGFSGGFSLRKALVITQFTVSQLLIIGTIVVATQMDYFYSRDMGYRKEGILTVQVPENDAQKMEQFRNTLMTMPAVKQVSFSSGPPTSAGNGFSTIRKTEAPSTTNINTERKFVDPAYLETFEIQLLAGRNLQPSDRVFLTDSTLEYNVLLNNKAILALGFKTPYEALGQQMIVGEKERATIVGVTDDFFNVSLQRHITPCLLFYATNWVDMASIQMENTASPQTMAAIESGWKTAFPGHIYQSMTLEYYMKHKAFYVIEDIMYQGFKVFVFIALLIGCLGLYGLVSFLALQRQKEIGIRKVLGSSVKGIVFLFSKEFAWMVVISFVIAAPLGYLAMQSWLQTFANRIELSSWYFILALLLSLLIAGFTVGGQAVKAAIANPVKSLKAE
jgi:ABC-type lipoprotein release transport system permease subunit